MQTWDAIQFFFSCCHIIFFTIYCLDFFFFFFVQVSLKHGAPKEEKNKNTKRLIFGQSCWSGRSPLARWQLSLPLAASDNEAKISNHPFRAPWRNNRVCNCVFGILIWRQTAEFLFYKNTVNSDSSNECFGGGNQNMILPLVRRGCSSDHENMCHGSPRPEVWG